MGHSSQLLVMLSADLFITWFWREFCQVWENNSGNLRCVCMNTTRFYMPLIYALLFFYLYLSDNDVFSKQNKPKVSYSVRNTSDSFSMLMNFQEMWSYRCVTMSWKWLHWTSKTTSAPSSQITQKCWGHNNSFQIVQKFQGCMNIPLEKQWKCLFSCICSKPVSLYCPWNNQ